MYCNNMYIYIYVWFILTYMVFDGNYFDVNYSSYLHPIYQIYIDGINRKLGTFCLHHRNQKIWKRSLLAILQKALKDCCPFGKLHTIECLRCTLHHWKQSMIYSFNWECQVLVPPKIILQGMETWKITEVKEPCILGVSSMHGRWNHRKCLDLDLDKKARRDI